MGLWVFSLGNEWFKFEKFSDIVEKINDVSAVLGLKKDNKLSRICSLRNCKNESYENHQECVLHCDKENFDAFQTNQYGFKFDFYTALAYEVSDYLKSKIFSGYDSGHFEEIFQFLCGTYDNDKCKIAQDLKNINLTLHDIKFPNRYSEDWGDYQNLLDKFRAIYFVDCEFWDSGLDLTHLSFTYFRCNFLKEWSIGDSLRVQGHGLYKYINCKFESRVTLDFISDESLKTPKLTGIFSNCVFGVGLIIRDSVIHYPLFSNIEIDNVEIPNFHVKNSSLFDNLTLNKLISDSLIFENSKFLSKVEIQKCDITEAKFIDSDFKSSFDAYGTKFGKFFAATTIFSDFAGFERCEFGKASDENGVAQFEYVTFLSFANIRNTIFHQGLNLEDTNLKEAPNFLNIQLLSDNTNRETYRIIKHSFDKIGNHIEANRFYAKEMDKYQQSLKDKPISQEKIIFWLNKYSSNFGQSYLLPIFWIAVFTGIYYLIIQGYESEILYSSYLPWNEKINFFATKLNDVASNVIPFKNLMKESKGYEFITLIFYVVLASLIWQTIVALKRYTQR